MKLAKKGRRMELSSQQLLAKEVLHEDGGSLDQFNLSSPIAANFATADEEELTLDATHVNKLQQESLTTTDIAA
ncbi:hypothetical protein PIB30_071909 [Stylosanthes scabra]|uniref:Uncharacterized protein n=1 Tax=Stylosanthes scabra TaxID=79078 RepID=A0ABU6TQI0_9FABA|nr:hypothetical protein [Stylosanthes scabra]